MENRDTAKKVFAWEGVLTHLTCAGIFTVKGKRADEAGLANCKALLKQNVSVFSNFRSSAAPEIASLLAVSGDPQTVLERGLEVYRLLKKEFSASLYLPFAAMIIAQLAKSYQYEEIAQKTRRIYKKMQSLHPFLTSAEDSAFCALLAVSGVEEDALVEACESCYRILKPEFFSANAVWSLGQVLALYEGGAEEKCQKVMELFRKLKEAGCKYGTDYELPTLGVLAMSGEPADELVREIKEADEWLSRQKGFGIFGSVTRKQRLMYAGMLVQQSAADVQVQTAIGQSTADTALQAAALQSTIAVIIAQETAMLAAIAASTAAATSTLNS